jgi:hypothetical protein
MGYSEKLLDVHFASEPHDLVHLLGQFAVDECIVLAVNLQGPNLKNSRNLVSEGSMTFMASVLLCCSSVRLKLISLIGKSHLVVSPITKSLYYNDWDYFSFFSCNLFLSSVNLDAIWLR